MSLEEALNRNSDLLEKQNGLLEQMLGAAKTAQANAGSAAETKPKKGAKDKDVAKSVTVDDVKTKAGAWLGEFPKDGDDDHPETVARKAEFKKQLEKYSAKNLLEIPAEKLADVDAWLDKSKAKGRLVADEETSSDDDDDMLG